MDGDKTDGQHIIEPAHKPGDAGQVAVPFDVSVSGMHVISLDSGQIADNPLAIRDPVKHDANAAYSRKVITWAASVMLLSFSWASIYGQLICTPPRNFDPPFWLVCIIAGVFFGLTANLIEKLLEAWEDWRRGK